MGKKDKKILTPKMSRAKRRKRRNSKKTTKEKLGITTAAHLGDLGGGSEQVN